MSKADRNGSRRVRPTDLAAATPRYSVSEVARLAGLSPSMVRWVERQGLITPPRTSGGHRVFTDAELARLRRIAYLRRVERLNAPAIRRELGAADPPSENGAAEIDPALGRRLRALRLSRRRSLASIAAKTGLSISFLSAVERGRSGISMANLIKLADAHGTTVPGLHSARSRAAGYLVRPSGRPTYVADSGRVRIQDLITLPSALQAMRYEVAPSGESAEAYTHVGQEFVHLLSGEMTFWIEERQRIALKPGDSLSFPSSLLHRWRNEGNEAAVLIWVNAVDAPDAGAPSLRTRTVGPTRERVAHRAAKGRR